MDDLQNRKKNMGLSRLRAGLVLGTALLVSGCGWWSGEDRETVVERGCPNAGILTDAQHLVEYRPGGGRDITDVAYSWELLDAAAICKYDDNIVDVDYALSLSVSLGPAATLSVVKAPIFVAITRSGDSVVQKSIFEADVEFELGQRTAVYTRMFEGLEFDVGEDDGGIYDVVVGFQLTPEQVRENRSKSTF